MLEAKDLNRYVELNRSMRNSESYNIFNSAYNYLESLLIKDKNKDVLDLIVLLNDTNSKTFLLNLMNLFSKQNIFKENNEYDRSKLLKLTLELNYRRIDDIKLIDCDNFEVSFNSFLLGNDYYSVKLLIDRSNNIKISELNKLKYKNTDDYYITYKEKFGTKLLKRCYGSYKI